uniref:Similar to protein kinase family protein / WD-40 repeat family protein n=1 Tax=Arundo donax TaxID=35708 RepID=A0A0A9HPR9_ARUDO
MYLLLLGVGYILRTSHLSNQLTSQMMIHLIFHFTLTLEEGEDAISHLKDSMNMVVSSKLQQMHLCNHLWIYFLSGVFSLNFS